MRGAVGGGLLLKFSIVFSSRWFWLHQKARWSTSFLKADSSPSVINPEGCIVHKFQEFDRRVARGAAVGVEDEEFRREHVSLWCSSADGPGLRDKLSQPHILLPVCEEVSDPPAGGLGPTCQSMTCSRCIISFPGDFF